MSKKNILFLTNPDNKVSTEDFLLANYLEANNEGVFKIAFSSLLNLDYRTLKKFDLILIRDILTDIEKNFLFYRKLETRLREYLKKTKLKVYTPLNGKDGFCGKDYLLKLFQLNYPVIPTIDSLEDISLLPSSKEYLVKAKNGYNSWKIEIFSKKALLKNKVLITKKFLIQPKLNFQSEISFYFLDEEFQHALIYHSPKYPHKGKAKAKEYQPTSEEMFLARKFTKWNKLPIGLQRIDFLKFKNGELILVEIEDATPALCFNSLSPKLRKKFLKNLKASIINYLN